MLVAAHSALALSNTTGAGAIHVSPSLCENLVECRDGVIRTGAHHACGTVPECSGRGSCQDGLSCRCDRGWFGRDCSHRERDCSQLRSCVDCQDAANQAFCGWCAAGHYCVPKHVHKALAKRGRECLAWFEDTCPAAHTTNATGTGTVGPGGAGADDGLWELAALGDESSVMLAEALTSLYEEGSSGEGNGQRASSWGSVLLVLSVAAASLRCLVIEASMRPALYQLPTREPPLFPPQNRFGRVASVAGSKSSWQRRLSCAGSAPPPGAPLCEAP